MGISVDRPDRLTLASGAQVVRFQNVLAPHERINDVFDACYVPRTFHLTGDLDLHDIGVDAMTGRFSSTRDSIVSRHCRQNTASRRSGCRRSSLECWTATSAISTGSRCCKGKPAYVTAVSRSDVIDGWRDRRADGGVVVDVEANRIVCEGLSMPHSPRMHRGELWLVNSGTGEIGVVEGLSEGKGRFAPRAFCPGFLRGLAFRDKYAFVGLSKPRYKRFEGLALDDRLKRADAEPWCGVQIIDLDAGGCIDWLRIDGAVAELYDVAVIPGFRRPMALTPFSGEAAALITFEAD